jgi:hypothetical protein
LPSVAVSCRPAEQSDIRLFGTPGVLRDAAAGVFHPVSINHRRECVLGGVEQGGCGDPKRDVRRSMTELTRDEDDIATTRVIRLGGSLAGRRLTLHG